MVVARHPLVEDDLRWKMTFSGGRPSLDPCMLPTPLCGILFQVLTFVPLSAGARMVLTAPYGCKGEGRLRPFFWKYVKKEKKIFFQMQVQFLSGQFY